MAALYANVNKAPTGDVGMAYALVDLGSEANKRVVC